MAQDDVDIEEQEYARELAVQQAQYQEEQAIQRVVDEGKSFRSPSKIKYGILFTLAAISDGIDLFEFTGIGWFFAKIVDLACSALIIIISLATGTKQKQANNYQKRLKDIVESSGRNLAHRSRIIMRIGKISQHVPWLNGFVEYIVATFANLIPIIDLAPWMIIGVWLSYMDEKKTLASARQTADAVAAEL